MAEREHVLLEGGPFDGTHAWVAWGTPLLCEGTRGEPIPDGMVARYRPSRRRGVYRFRELERIVARVPVASPSSLAPKEAS